MRVFFLFYLVAICFSSCIDRNTKVDSSSIFSSDTISQDKKNRKVNQPILFKDFIVDVMEKRELNPDYFFTEILKRKKPNGFSYLIKGSGVVNYDNSHKIIHVNLYRQNDKDIVKKKSYLLLMADSIVLDSLLVSPPEDIDYLIWYKERSRHFEVKLFKNTNVMPQINTQGESSSLYKITNDKIVKI